MTYIPALITIACVVFFAFTLLLGLGKAAANGDAFLGLEKVVPRSSPRTGSDGLSDRADRERKGPQSYSTTAEHMPECKTPSLNESGSQSSGNHPVKASLGCGFLSQHGKDAHEITKKPRGGLALPQADFSKLFLAQKGLRRI